MTSEKNSRTIIKSILRWLIPIAISAGAIWLVLRNIQVSEILQNLSKIGLRAILLASGIYFISYFFRAYSWYILLRRKVSFKDVFFIMGTGYLLNNIFPFRLGEIGRAVLLDDPEGPSALEVLSSIVVERIFDVFLAAVFVLGMLPRIIGGEGFDQTLILAALLLTISGLTVLYLIVKFRKKIMTWLDTWGQKSDFVNRWITTKVSQVLEGLTVLTDPKAFLLAFGSLFLSWFLAFGENFVIFRNLYADPPFWWMVFVLGAGAFGVALPSAPAGLGVFEGAMVAAFSLLGVSPEVGFTHAIVIHALAFVYANILGLIGLRMRGQALVALYRRVIHRSPTVETLK